jgi:hypothetical protein
MSAYLEVIATSVQRLLGSRADLCRVARSARFGHPVSNVITSASRAWDGLDARGVYFVRKPKQNRAFG